MMHDFEKKELKDLLEAWRHGDVQALNELVGHLYEEIKSVARSCMNRFGNRANILSTTTLGHEAYLRLVRYQPNQKWEYRGQFFSLISKVMLGFLVDLGRGQATQKRGGDQIFITLEASDIGSDRQLDSLVVSDMLESLEKKAPRQANLWRCRYLLGLAHKELAEAFEISLATVQREIKTANGWLQYKWKEHQT